MYLMLFKAINQSYMYLMLFKAINQSYMYLMLFKANSFPMSLKIKVSSGSVKLHNLCFFINLPISNHNLSNFLSHKTISFNLWLSYVNIFQSISKTKSVRKIKQKSAGSRKNSDILRNICKWFGLNCTIMLNVKIRFGSKITLP